MTGYIRKDVTNNIADGNIINADDLDNEFDGIQVAFDASVGHTHDGSASEGAPITKVGPVQDVLITTTAVYPKITNTVDLGTSSLKYKDAFIAGNETVGGTLAVTGVTTLTAQPILSSLTASSAVATDASKGLVSVTNTGTGNNVLATSPTLVTPALGTPSALVGTNITGTATNFTATRVTTNANLTGMVTSVGNATTVVTNANLTGAVTSVGNATSLGSFTSANLAAALTDETGSGAAVFATSPTLVTPALGTPSALVGTNITGTATNFTASNVTTNANLTGAITSVGNAASLGSFTSLQLLTALTDKTGTGSTVFATSPTLITPALGAATGTSLILSAATSTDALRITQTGTGNAFVVEDSTSPDTTPFIVNSTGRVLIARDTASVIADGILQVTVQGATLPGVMTNTGSTSYRPHWSLAVADTEVASFGTTNTLLNTYVGGASRMTISSLGSTVLYPVTGAGSGLTVSGTNLSGATTNISVFSNTTFGSAATTRGEGFQTTLGTEAATFTLGELGHFKATQGTFGLNSVVTSQYGFYANSTLIGATNNYGFYSELAAATGRFNFYAAGTATNYFSGSVGIGSNAPSSKVQITVNESTAYDGAATDGQLAVGSTLFIQQTAGTNTGVAQIVFQPRTTFPYNRIVSSGGSAPFMTFVTNNTERVRISSTGKVGIATVTPLVSLDITGTDALKVPVGTTAERPTGSTGYFRFNSSNVQFEGYNGSAWAGVGGASGGGGNPIMYENDNVVSVSYTMTTGKNASSTGPLTINDGIAVTVPSGSTWVIL